MFEEALYHRHGQDGEIFSRDEIPRDGKSLLAAAGFVMVPFLGGRGGGALGKAGEEAEGFNPPKRGGGRLRLGLTDPIGRGGRFCLGLFTKEPKTPFPTPGLFRLGL